MAQEPNEIRQHMNEERARLGDDLHEIDRRVKDAFDWKAWYRKNTVTMLGVAAASGFLLSMAIGGRSSKNRGEPLVEAETEYTEGSEWRAQQKNGRVKAQLGSLMGHHVSRLTDILDNTVGAFLGVATNKLQDYVSKSFPGFREQYSEAERIRGRSYPS
jgi:hypothetical protein